MTKVLIYTKENLNKSGRFKKSFVPNWISKEDFFKYLRDNNLNIKSNYIDISGIIVNTDKMFRCSYGDLIIGTSGIVKEFEGAK